MRRLHLGQFNLWLALLETYQSQRAAALLCSGSSTGFAVVLMSDQQVRTSCAGPHRCLGVPAVPRGEISLQRHPAVRCRTRCRSAASLERYSNNYREIKQRQRSAGRNYGYEGS